MKYSPVKSGSIMMLDAACGHIPGWVSQDARAGYVHLENNTTCVALTDEVGGEVEVLTPNGKFWVSVIYLRLVESK